MLSLSHETEQSSDTGHDTNEPRKHATKNPDTKGHLLCNPIDVRCLGPVNPQTDSRLVAARGCGEGEYGVTAGLRGFFLG